MKHIKLFEARTAGKIYGVLSAEAEAGPRATMNFFPDYEMAKAFFDENYASYDMANPSAIFEIDTMQESNVSVAADWGAQAEGNSKVLDSHENYEN